MPHEPEMPKEVASEPDPAGADLLEVGELLSLPQAARAVAMSPESLRSYVRRGRLPARKVGRDWATTLAAVEAYLASRDLSRIPGRYRNRG